MRFASCERSECFIEVVRLLLHIDEVDASLKNIRVAILTSKHRKKHLQYCVIFGVRNGAFPFFGICIEIAIYLCYNLETAVFCERA